MTHAAKTNQKGPTIMIVGIVDGERIRFEDWDRLDQGSMDQRLEHESEAIPLESPLACPGEPFVGFVRKGGMGAGAEKWRRNVMIPRNYWGDPDSWLYGPVIVAAHREDGKLRSLTEQEQQQVQIWGGGPQYRYPLLMMADPE